MWAQTHFSISEAQHVENLIERGGELTKTKFELRTVALIPC
jgi:hypothetical protein